MTRPVAELPKIAACKRRIANQECWEAAGAYEVMQHLVVEHGQYDGCRNALDIARRYRNLDHVIASIAADGRLMTRKELNSLNFREAGGVVVHVGRSAQLIFGGGGCHRLAIAQALGLRLMPAQLGVVHREAVKEGLFTALLFDSVAAQTTSSSQLVGIGS